MSTINFTAKQAQIHFKHNLRQGIVAFFTFIWLIALLYGAATYTDDRAMVALALVLPTFFIVPLFAQYDDTKKFKTLKELERAVKPLKRNT